MRGPTPASPPRRRGVTTEPAEIVEIPWSIRLRLLCCEMVRGRATAGRGCMNDFWRSSGHHLLDRDDGGDRSRGGALTGPAEESVGGRSRERVSPLVAVLGLPPAGDIDVLKADNAASYWHRSDLFDMALDLTAGRRGLAALGEVIGRW